MKKICFLLILLAGCQQVALAACETNRFGVVFCGRGDCAKDKAGDVFCSKYQFGHAHLDEHGNVVCGKGECAAGRKFKEIYCSTVENGGAEQNIMGDVKCYGGCEKASALMCESEEGR